MKIVRHFTASLPNPYAYQKYEARSVEIREHGKVVFRRDAVTVPETWSQTATEILASKYLRPASDTFGGESDARQAFHRLAGCWTDWGKRHGYFDGEGDAAAFYDEICYMLAHQIASPNSPQWFNTGLHFAYGIRGDAQGHWYVDPKTGKPAQSTSAYEHPQAHACFIQSITDDLCNPGGIFDLWLREARLFKFGSGSGTNFSALRGSGEVVKGGGVSSGLMSFLRVGDAAAAAIQSGGTTRRAAKMVCVDADHPEIEEFIEWKVHEEGKVAALVAGQHLRRRHLQAVWQAHRAPDAAARERVLAGARAAGIPEEHLRQARELAAENHPLSDEPEYDFDWRGEAYRSVSGQNSNNSVRLPNTFFSALENDGKWALRRRTDGRIAREVPARELWDRIAFAAWASADPGLHFSTTINEWHTCPAGGEIRASNPCSEFLFIDDTGCNLASLNLLKFLNDDGSLALDSLAHAARLWTIVLEITVLMAQYPSRAIAERSYQYRTLGLGYANLGALLMSQGLAYGEPRAAAMTGAITALLCAESYAASAEMAREKGPFPRFTENRAAMLRVIRNHRRAAYGSKEYEGLTLPPAGIDEKACPPKLLAAARLAWDRALAWGEAHGFRNAQVTALAPTGTIGLLMDCDTMGIEPEFALVKGKRLAGGGALRILNQSIPRALKALGYSDTDANAIRAYCLGHATLRGAPGVSWRALAERGVAEARLEEIESLIARAWSLDDLLAHAGIDARQLGFSEEQIAATDRFVFGYRGVEGAPGLRPEHAAVFDCAQPCGRGARRALGPTAHLAILAAAQPFLSGGISKTINLPVEATPEDVRSALLAAWLLGLKAVSLYRDGAKLSQPLTAEVASDPPQPIAQAPLCLECG